MDNTAMKRGRWISALILVLVLGNLASFYLMRVLLNTNLGLAHLTPFVFLVAPAVGIVIIKRGNLLKQSDQYRAISIVVLILYLAAWMFAVYVYLSNAFPNYL